MKKALAFLAVLLLALAGFGATKTFTIASVTPNCGGSTTPAVSVDDASGLTDVSFTVAYDPAMLTHTGCTILAPGWAVGTCSAAGGVVTVAISGPALGAGALGLVSVDFNVLGTACDGDSTALNLEAVLYNTTNSGTAVDGLCTIACPANVPPAAFTNTAPADGAVDVATAAVVIDWADSAGATSYDLYFGTANPPALLQAGIAASTFTVAGPLANNTTYYWYVVASDACGTTTGAQWSFTTCALPGAFANTAPADAAPAVALTNVVLDWADSTGATSYDLYFGTANPPALLQAGIAVSTYTVAGPLTASTVYYWYVIANNSCGSATGAQWSFTTTGGAPSCGLQHIADGGFEGGTPSASWTEASTNFGTPLCDGSCGGPATHSGSWYAWFGGIAAFEEGSVSQSIIIPPGTTTLTFYLEAGACAAAADFLEVTIDGTQVFLINGSDASCGVASYALKTVNLGAFADGAAHTIAFHSIIYGTGITNFFVDDISLVDCPCPFNLLSPADASIDQPINGLVLDWADALGATAYDLYLDTANPPTTIVASNLTASTYTISGLATGTTYYWFVNAKNVCGTPVPSATWSFTTVLVANPALSYLSSTLLDACPTGGAGGGNGIIDPGEDVTLTVTAQNTGAGNASGITATLSSASPGVTITTASAAYPNILAGGTGVSMTPYAFHVDFATACGTTLNFTLDFVSAQGTWSSSFTLAVGSTVIPLLTQNFDAVVPPALPAGWATAVVSGTDPELPWITNVGRTYPAGTAHSAPNTARFRSFSIGATVPQSSRLYTTSGLDLSGASASQLTFWMYHDTGYTTANDNIQAQVSTDGGTVWNNVGAAIPRYDGTAQWTQHTVDLSAYAGQADVRVGFLGTSYYGNDCYIDTVRVTGTMASPVCTACTPGAPTLAYQGRSYTDLCASGGVGSGDGIADPGESLSVTVQLTNSGTAMATGVSAVLSTPTAGVSVTTPNASYPNILAGGTQASTTPYVVYIAETVPCTTLIDFALAITSAEGTWTGAFQILVGSPAGAVLLTQNFDGVVPPALPAGWATVTVSGTSASLPWVTNIGRTYPAGAANSAPNTARFRSYSISGTTQSSRLYITSGLDMTGYSSAQVSFYMYHDTGYATDPDRIQAQVSTDGGTTWTNVGAAIPRYQAASNFWSQHTVDLSAYAGQPSVQVGFLGISDFGNDCYLDDITVSTTGVPTCTICVCPLPGAFNLLAPPDAATGLPLTNVVLDWEDSVGATSYDVAFGTVNPPPPIATALTSTYTVAGPLLPSTTYYWSVTARNACGVLASAVWSFTTTCAAPGAFALLTPPNAATAQAATNLLLDWTDSPGATSYDLYFGATNPPPTYQVGLVASQYIIAGPLLANTTYYWSVTAINGCGTLSTAVWSFTTGSSTPPCTPPSAVTLVTPPSGATDVPVPVTLTWTADPNATSYEIGLGLTPTNLAQVAIVTGTSYTLTGLTEGTTYYWRVSALNACGFANSPVASFTTAGQVGPTGSTIFIPAVASATGDRSSQWKTDLQIMNRSTDDKTATFSITFIPADTDGTLSTHIITGSLGPGQMKKYEDIVETAFGLTETSGGLRIVADQPVIAICRTYNDTGEGTYGQLVKGYGPDAVLGLPDLRGVFRQGETGHLIHLISGMTFRSNVGFMEVTGNAATVQIALFDDLNAPLGTKTYTLLPMGFHQVSDIFTDMGITGNHAAARAEVTVSGAGSVLAYASIIDNTTNDAIFTVAQKLLGVSSEAVRTLPATASTRGAMDTLWRTDVRVLNPTADPLDVTYTYRPVTGAVQTRTLTVPSMNILYAANVLNQLFAISDNTHGSMEVKAASPLVVSSRIYTGVEGTYGQCVPANRSDEGIVEEDFGLLLGMRTDEEYRTNLGFTEIAGGSITLLVQLHDLAGAYLGQTWLTLAPYEHYSINDVFAYLGLYGTFEAYAVVQGQDGPGRAAAYASVVDNRTGDAIYVPAQ